MLEIFIKLFFLKKLRIDKISHTDYCILYLSKIKLNQLTAAIGA